MNKGKISLKEEAQQALSKGDLKKALDRYQKHCSQDPKDLRSCLRTAELEERLGQKEEAVQTYRKVAEAYAQDGFLLQAISVNKIILRIDPSARDINERLAQLYTEKTHGPGPVQASPRIPLFSDLDEKEIQSLLQGIQAKVFPREAVICREGDKGDSLFIISRGEVAITKVLPHWKEVGVCTLKEGDFFGEFGFFTDQKRHATVKAVTDCEVLEISRDQLNEIIETYPRIKEALNNLFKHRVLDTFLVLSPLFSALGPEEREKVIRRFRLHKVAEGTLIFQQGDPPTSVYMIKSGEVEIFSQTRHGKKVAVATLKGGNIFGEIGPLFNKPRVASAKATRPAELLELSKEDLEACLSQSPSLQTALKEMSIRRLARLNEMFCQEEIDKAREAMV